MKLLPKILALSLAMVVTTSVAANQLANEKTAISVNYKNNRYPLLQKPYIELRSVLSGLPAGCRSN